MPTQKTIFRFNHQVKMNLTISTFIKSVVNISFGLSFKCFILIWSSVLLTLTLMLLNKIRKEDYALPILCHYWPAQMPTVSDENIMWLVAHC